MSFRVNVETAVNETRSVDTYSKIIWQHQLNGNGLFEVLVVGGDTDYTASFQKGRVINFYKNGALDMKGVIEKITFTSEGLMRIQGIEKGAKIYSNANVTTKSYSASTSITVINDLQTNAPGVSLNTVNSGSIASFRVFKNQTCLQVLGKLAELEGKDWYFDYSGATVRLNYVNSKGAANVTLLNGQADVGVVTKEEDDTQKVNKVTVIGAGEGAQQISCYYQVGWVQGCPETTITDKSIATNAEALARATIQYNILSTTKYNYTFNVLDANRTFSTGDTLTLKDNRTATNALLRIVSVKRVITKEKEELQLEVRSTTDRERAEDRLSRGSALKSYVDNNNDMVQGADLSGLCACLAGMTCACSLSVQPVITVCYVGAITSQGYFYGGYNDAASTGAWYYVNNSASVPANANSCNKYLGHGVWINIGEGLLLCGCGNYYQSHQVAARIYNTTNGTYFPSSAGIVLNKYIIDVQNAHNHCMLFSHCHCTYTWHQHSTCLGGFELHCHWDYHCHAGFGGDTGPRKVGGVEVPCTCYPTSYPSGCTCGNPSCYCFISSGAVYGGALMGAYRCTENEYIKYTNMVNYSTFIWLPFDWYNTTYRVEYCFENGCCYFGCRNISYSYFGILGHCHPGTASCCDLSHCHCTNLVGNVCYCICYL